MNIKHTDKDLVNKIKKHEEVTDSLGTLISRHSGIYYDIISRYVPLGSIYCNRSELFEDKELNIYNAALKFDPDRGAKFSTFLGNETKWVCLNAYNKAKKKPLISKAPEDLDFIKKATDSREFELGDGILLKEIFLLVNKHPDRRVGDIFKLRYREGDGNKVLAWKHVAPKVGLSIQGCINVHDMVIEDLKRKLKL